MSDIDQLIGQHNNLIKRWNELHNESISIIDNTYLLPVTRDVVSHQFNILTFFKNRDLRPFELELGTQRRVCVMLERLDPSNKKTQDLKTAYDRMSETLDSVKKEFDLMWSALTKKLNSI
jgi:hypothetical protein